VRPAKGVHLYLRAERFPRDTALYLSTAADGRLVFVVPWLGRTLVGTTDTAYAGALAAPRATAADVGYLLDAVNRAFPALALTPADVLSTQAGLRPLIAVGGADTSTLPRGDRVFETATGAIAIAGGKLTTFRTMAQKVVDLAARRLDGPRGAGATTTAALPLAGFTRPLDAAAYAAWRGAALAEVRDDARARRARLIARYGANYAAVEALIQNDASLAAPLAAGQPVLKAEALFAVRHEQAATIADVLAQRLRLTLVTNDGGASAAGAVADMLAAHYGWSAARKQAALDGYAAEVTQYAVPEENAK
jgi:glycerol-3-phosphate dehydrogenase